MYSTPLKMKFVLVVFFQIAREHFINRTTLNDFVFKLFFVDQMMGREIPLEVNFPLISDSKFRLLCIDSLWNLCLSLRF